MINIVLGGENTGGDEVVGDTLQKKNDLIWGLHPVLN